MRLLLMLLLLSGCLSAQSEAFLFDFDQITEQLQYRTNKIGKINTKIPKKWVEIGFQEKAFSLLVSNEYFVWKDLKRADASPNPIFYSEMELADCKGVRSVGDSYTCVKGLDWEIQSESKRLLSYDVRRATTKIKEAPIEVWYAPFLKFPAGSTTIYGLPGVILQMQITKGSERVTYTAKNMTLVF